MSKRASLIAAVTSPSALEDFALRLDTLVAAPTVSRNPGAATVIRSYLTDLLLPELAELGFSTAVLENTVAPDLPFLLAERIEDPAAETILIYGHGDVVEGMETGWTRGAQPFRATIRDGRIHGRGTADNKGQHAINIAALRAVVAARGTLGFNCKILIEMGEERGSPGLAALFREHSESLRADVLIASDGPRLNAGRPTLFLGARGSLRFDLTVSFRSDARHSGHWGGLLRDPGIELAYALTAISGRSGALQVPGWRPDSLTPDIRARIAQCGVGEIADQIDADWGEPGLTPAERVFGWNSFAVLALDLGTPGTPVAAIAPTARAHCQLRFVVGTDPGDIVPALKRHLVASGFDTVTITEIEGTLSPATRLDPADPWVARVTQSIVETTGAEPDILPNIGGSIPNHIFADIAGLPTLWIPHSYRGCRQHAPDEHLPLDIACEGLAVMAGLFWDIGVAANHPLR